MDFNMGSATGLSDRDRAIMSAAHKYRHRIPSTEAIEEENENLTKGAVNISNGMFKRNPCTDDDDNIGLRKTPTDYFYYDSRSGQDNKGRDHFSTKVLSGSAQPTALHRH